MGAPASLLFLGFGFSNVSSGGLAVPLLLPSRGACQLWIDPLATQFLVPSAADTWPLSIPAHPLFDGTEIYFQTLEVSPGGALVFLSTNGVEARLGMPVLTNITHAQLDAAMTDAAATALAAPTVVGGDGRHGSFNPSTGTMVAPSVFEFNTGNTTLPGRLTLANSSEVVTDGHYYFTAR